MNNYLAKRNNVMRLSKTYMPTLKEDPVDAEIPSHRLLIRAGMMRKVSAGIYSFLPLGLRVLHKVEQIVREEMDAIGAEELLMPILQPAELWHESGRWDVYGPELMRLTDRHGHDYALSPTQEEMITSLVRNVLRSYKDLPKTLYHIQWKYRDEIRPRFGLLRSREFLMKDAYSFHTTQESLQEEYDRQAGAYSRICERLELAYRPVAADSGQIGGDTSVEFMALADSGEAELVYCDTPGCSYAANVEAADAIPVLHTYNGIAEKPVEGLTKVHTPIEGSISALAKFLNIPEDATVKALSGKDADGQVYVLFIPGDHELNPLKAEHAFNGFDLLSDDEMLAAELVKGFMGPVGLPAGVKVVADESLRNIEQWVVGANEPDYHYIGATLNKDFKVDTWADLIQAKPGDMCPKCAAAGHAGAALKGARGIEVGQVFQLGTKYSDAMGATYMAEDGSEQPYIMGCYGWGVTRSLAAVVEQYHDDNGIIWPVPICPAAVCVIPLNTGDDLVEPTAQRIAQELADKGIETALDDRAERAGVKFNDADLIGWPYQVVCGKRGLQNGIVELKCRATGEKQDVPLDNIVDVVATALRR